MRAILPLALLALVLGPGPAAAAGNPTVYQSNDGVDPGEPKQLWAAWTQTIDLYVCLRSTDGTTCGTESGDELHGIDVIVEVEGDAQFTGFAEHGDIVHYPEEASFPSPRFRLNAVQGSSAPSPGPQLLGTLTLDTGTGGVVVKARGQVVRADGALKDIPTRIIARSSGTECSEGPDSDGDGVADVCDNCLEVGNGPLVPDAGGNAQVDTDQDGYGNVCDCDLDNDGICGATDFFGVFRPCLGADLNAQPSCREADCDGDDIVGATDFFGCFRPGLGGPPGPSGLPCAGTVPCP